MLSFIHAVWAEAATVTQFLRRKDSHLNTPLKADRGLTDDNTFNSDVHYNYSHQI
jgi:hypothetical protein